MNKPTFSLIAAAFLMLVGASPADAGRDLHGLRSTVGNLDRFGALGERYWDGERVLLASPSATKYVRKHVGRVRGEIADGRVYLRRLTPDERADPAVPKLTARLDHWNAYIEKVAASMEKAASGQASGDQSCRAFEAEVTNDHKRAILSLARRSDNSGISAGSLGDIAARAREVVAVCAKPAYRDVGKQGCHWLKRTDYDPAMWCETAPRWKEILTARIEATVARKLGAFANRPLLSNNLKGDQSLQFFARAVPNADGWREASSWEALHFEPAERADYLARLNKMYAELGLAKRLTNADLAPIEDAFAQLRADAIAAAPGFRLPQKEGAGYSVGLARKQVTGFVGKAKVRAAFLSRASWRIHKNGLGVPLRRTRPGYVLVGVRGQKLCQLIGYTVTEDYKGGGRYQRARGVRFGASRFQGCR